MKKRSTKRLAAFVCGAAILVALVAAGCGSSSSNSSGSSSSNDTGSGGKIVIGIPGPAAALLPANLAEEEGLFEQEGLDVEVKIIPPQQLVTALAGGSVQFAALASPQPDIAALTGRVKWYGSWENHPNADLLANGGITSVSELSGKTVAASAPGTLQAIFVGIALESAGMSAGDVHTQILGDPTAAIAPFSKGTLNAFVSTEPTTGLVLGTTEGAQSIYSYKGLDWTAAGLAGNTGWVEGHEDETVALLSALNKGLALWHSNPEEAKKTIAKVAAITEEKALDAAYQSTLDPKAGVSKELEPVSQKTEEFVLETMQANDIPNADPAKWEEAVDSALLAKATK
ncbi:MAG: ABC transporter substrate-binding protein [Actinobacteria bacterium]|nr:ABC transporter substrate-binding protein [Actinomycetota bacterium]